METGRPQVKTKALTFKSSMKNTKNELNDLVLSRLDLSRPYTVSLELSDGTFDSCVSTNAVIFYFELFHFHYLL